MSDEARLDSIREAFDARSATYDESRMHRDVAAAVAAFAELDGVVNVLDVATGTGLVLRALAVRSPTLALTGIDLSPGMLENARSELPTAAWRVADAASLPLDDRSVDLITCVTALHVIPDTASALAEWRRLLRPGGRVVTATFADARPRSTSSRSTPYPSDHDSYGSVEKLSHLAGAAGFDLARTTTWSEGEDALIIAEWVPR